MENNINDLIIGEIVIPSFNQTNQQEARSLASTLGIESLLNMPRCNTRNLLGKAVKMANRHQRDYQCLMVHEGPNKIQYVIVKKTDYDRGQDQDNNRLIDPSINVESRFYFSKENRDKNMPADQQINFFENPDHSMAQYIKQEYFNQAVIFSAEDMRRSANNMLVSLGSVQITRGNAWYCPKQQKDQLDKLSQWLKETGCFMARYTQLDIDNVKENLQNVCQDSLTSTLNDLYNLIEQHKLESKTRSSTFEKRIEDLNNLRATINTYTLAIQVDLTELQDQVDQCENDLVNFMTTAQTPENGF